MQFAGAAQTQTRCEFIGMNGHKDSDLLLIVQEKAKVNAISKEKRMRRAKDLKRSSNINNVRMCCTGTGFTPTQTAPESR